MELDGTIIGKFGKAGKALKEFSTIHEIDCRNPNELFVAEITAWRVQKILLKPQPMKSSGGQIGDDAHDTHIPAVRRPPRRWRSAPRSPRRASPEIAFDANADLLKLPDNIHLGEVAGVATNSKGHIFVYTRTGTAHATLGTSRTFYHGGSRLFEFDQTGKFVREIGQGVYGFNFAQAVRVDPQDNIWIVDAGSNQVIKFDPDGRIQLVLGRKPEAIAVRAGRGARRGAAEGRGGPPPEGRGAGAPPPPGGAPAAAPAAERRGPAGPPGAGIPGDNFNRPTDVAWDARATSTSPTAWRRHRQRARREVRQGRRTSSSRGATRGTEPGQFNTLRGIAIDAKGNVYVADARQQAHPGVRRRRHLQVADHRHRHARGDLHHAAARTSTSTARTRTTPRRMDNGEIYKMELDGKIVGKFGTAGKLPKEFGMVNAIDCRTENELLRRRAGELARAEGDAARRRSRRHAHANGGTHGSGRRPGGVRRAGGARRRR